VLGAAVSTSVSHDRSQHSLAPADSVRRVQTSVGPRSFSANYVARNELFDITGLEPQSDAPSPVYLLVTLVGGREQEIIAAMAERGYVAAWIEALPTPHNCTQLDEAAASIFTFTNQSGMERSALEVLCARASANCTAGIVVHGALLGGNEVFLAPKHSPYITALLSWAYFNILPGRQCCCSVTEQTCCNDPAQHPPGSYPGGTHLTCNMDEELSRYLPRSRRRAVSGAGDFWFTTPVCGEGPTVNDTDHGPIRQGQLASGYDCGTAAVCFDALDGSGYAVPPGVGHTVADFIESDQPWGLNASFDWAVARGPR